MHSTGTETETQLINNNEFEFVFELVRQQGTMCLTDENEIKHELININAFNMHFRKTTDAVVSNELCNLQMKPNSLLLMTWSAGWSMSFSRNGVGNRPIEKQT